VGQERPEAPAPRRLPRRRSRQDNQVNQLRPSLAMNFASPTAVLSILDVLAVLQVLYGVLGDEAAAEKGHPGGEVHQCLPGVWTRGLAFCCGAHLQ
jgi:hypothetical protein